MRKEDKLALVPGSFDPMTLGHRELIEEVLRRYRKVVVAVMVNREKKTLFDLETRLQIAKATLGDLPGVSVIADDGMLIDLFDRIGADVVCKGYRDETDLAYERVQDEWNRAHNPRFRTELIAATGAYAAVSSTLVRGKLANGEPIDDLVCAAAIPLILSKI